MYDRGNWIGVTVEPKPLLSGYRGFKLTHQWSAAESRWTTRAYYDGVLITMDHDQSDPEKSTAGVQSVLDTLCYWADNERRHWEK